MERNGESMGLIANLLHQIQRRRSAWQHHRTALLPWDKKLLVSLGQAGKRNIVDAHFVKHLKHGIELRQTAIENNQIGLRAKTLVGHALCTIPALHDLLHRQEVIGLIERRLDFKAAILVFIRPSAREHHHGGNSIRAMDGRDIEAFDAHRGDVHRERAFKLQQGVVDAFIFVVSAYLVAHERMLCILACHVEQISLFATLRHGEMNLRTMGGVELVGKPCFHR